MGYEIQFDPDTHAYTVDGIVRPSVTQIIKEAGCMGNTDWFTPESAERGRRVHQICEWSDNGTLDENSVAPEYIGYFVGWRNFLKDSGAQIIDIERRVFSEVWGYCGTVDRVVLWNGSGWVLDIKSGSVEPWVGLQTAGYEMAIGRRLKRAAIQLIPDGRYKVHEFKLRYDHSVFQSLVTGYNWKKLNGVI